VKQRESLVDATRLTPRLKKQIKKARDDQQFLEFTKKELEKMDEQIHASLACATRSQEAAERRSRQRSTTSWMT